VALRAQQEHINFTQKAFTQKAFTQKLTSIFLFRFSIYLCITGIGQVIKGWDEGLTERRVGEKRKLTIPARMGYGSRAMGSAIPANSALVFDVELLRINGKDEL
jgi:FKBP-type peptidyl-prolyl cis-trans isomerase 2